MKPVSTMKGGMNEGESVADTKKERPGMLSPGLAIHHARGG